jgi:hypothetical protein
MAMHVIVIYRQIKSQSDCLKLQEDLEAAIKWEQDWLMSFHPDKCNIMNITTKCFGGNLLNVGVPF